MPCHAILAKEEEGKEGGGVDEAISSLLSILQDRGWDKKGPLQAVRWILLRQILDCGSARRNQMIGRSRKEVRWCGWDCMHTCIHTYILPNASPCVHVQKQIQCEPPPPIPAPPLILNFSFNFGFAASPSAPGVVLALSTRISDAGTEGAGVGGGGPGFFGGLSSVLCGGGCGRADTGPPSEVEEECSRLREPEGIFGAGVVRTRWVREKRTWPLPRLVQDQ